MKIRFSDQQETESFGKILGNRVSVRPEWGKDIFFFGDMGSGKTTLIQSFGKSLGVTEPIMSPTFTLASEYDLRTTNRISHFTHFDIFRVGKDSVLTFPQIEEKFRQNDHVVAMEWSEHLPKNFLPEKRIEITLALGESIDIRIGHIDFCNPLIPDDELIKSLLEAAKVPTSLRKYTRRVMSLALFLAQKCIQKNIPLHFHLIRSLSLLHFLFWFLEDKSVFTKDFLKTGDAEEGDWNMLRKKFSPENTGEAMIDFLPEHDALDCVPLFPLLLHGTLEEKCVLLAQAYAQHEYSDIFVSPLHDVSHIEIELLNMINMDAYTIQMQAE